MLATFEKERLAVDKIVLGALFVVVDGTQGGT